MQRYPEPDPCRLGAGSAASVRRLLAEQLAASAERHNRSTSKPWLELTTHLVDASTSGPIEVSGRFSADDLLVLAIEVGMLVPPLARAGLVSPTLCGTLAQCLLESAEPLVGPAGRGAWFRLADEPLRRWRPGQPRLSHPAFRARHWWCAAELLRRILLAGVHGRLPDQPRVLPYGDSDGSFLRIRLLEYLDLQVRHPVGEFRITQPRGLGPEALSLSHPLADRAWLATLVDRELLGQVDLLATACAAATGHAAGYGRGGTGQALRDWLVCWLARELDGRGPLHDARRKLQRTCAVHPSLLPLAWQARPAGARTLSLADYQRVWRNAAPLLRLREEAPTLFPAYAALLAELDLNPLQGYGGLKQALRQRGLSRGGWSRLSAHAGPLLRALRRELQGGAARCVALVAVLNAIVASQRPGLPPAPLLRALVRTRPHFYVEQPLRVRPAVLAAAWDACLATPAMAGEIAREFDGLLEHWRFGHWRPGPLPPALAWRWFQRQLGQVRTRLALAPWLGAHWQAAVPEWRCQGLVAIALVRGEAVYAEALAMRHCLAVPAYLAEFQDGSVLPYSVRDARSGKRRYTLVLERTLAGWVVQQVAGFANAPACARARALAECLLDAHRAAVGEPARRGNRRPCPFHGEAASSDATMHAAAAA